MNKKMTRWGCGPQIIVKTIIVALIIYLLQYFLFPNFKLFISQDAAFILGGIWVFLGFLFWIGVALSINKYFKNGILMTNGIFRYVQHPLYSVFIFFYIPGIVIMTKSIIAFILPFVFYYFFRKYICFEEEYLEKKFGKKYLEYKKRTGRIFPKI